MIEKFTERVELLLTSFFTLYQRHNVKWEKSRVESDEF